MKITSIRPSKPVSVGSLVGLILMIIFGIAFTILILNVLFENEAPPAMFAFFIIFMLAWLGTAVFMLIYHALNLKREKGLSLMDVDSESETQTSDNKYCPMQRLRSLEELKRDCLITEEEFIKKRKEIMQEKW